MTKIIPFLETFWGLADESPQLRVKAAQSLLVHCFSNENAGEEDSRSADCAYALRRLLDGLNSGRASARQGFASCLSTFLKFAFAQKGTMQAIRDEWSKKDKNNIKGVTEKDNEINKYKDLDDWEFVRQELRRRTNINSTLNDDNNKDKQTSKKKGSEERDGVFGQLFGILAICRSGILTSAPKEVIMNYLSDVLSLYRWRKWMREPSAHAIVEILDSIESSAAISSKSSQINMAKIAIEQLILPFIFESDLTPEVLGISLFIERRFNIVTLAKDKRLIVDDCDSTLGNKILEALASTTSAISIIVPKDKNNTQSMKTRLTNQRRHLVWNQMSLLYTSLNNDEVQQRKMLSFIFKQFLEEFLLNSNSNPTPERRTLALALAMDYITLFHDDDNDGSLNSSSQCIRDFILTPSIVRKLFLNTIAASVGHILKEMASFVLDTIVQTCIQPKVNDDNEKSRNKTTTTKKTSLSLAIIQALIISEPKFDARTKTKTVSFLLSSLGPDEIILFLDFLEEQILNQSMRSKDSTELLIGTESLLNIYSNLNKTLLYQRYDNVSDDILDSIEHIRYRVLGFLLTGAFYDCTDMKPIKQKTKGSKKQQTTGDSNISLAVHAGRTIQKVCSSHHQNKDGSTKIPILPYPTRRMISTRFFSSLADFIVPPYNSNSPQNTKKSANEASGTEDESGNSNKLVKITNKTEYALKTLNWVFEQCEDLEKNHAKRFVRISENDMSDDENDDDDDDDKPLTMEEAKIQLDKFQKLSQRIIQDGGDSTTRSKGRAITGCTILLLSLNLQLLRCGNNEIDESGIEDDEEQEEEEEEENVIELIKDLTNAMNAIIDLQEKQIDDDRNNTINPLTLLADVCVSTLSLFEKTNCPSRSTKMLRESTKMAWTGTLASLSSCDSLIIDKSVVDVVLEAICDDESIAQNDDEENEDEEMEDADNMSVNDNDNTFSAITESGVDISDQDDDEESAKSSNADKKDSDDEDENVGEKDVEIDSIQLQNLLLEDNDFGSDDENNFELEHHEGADAALAQLIKLKQETRKQARGEKERIEFAHRLRCVQLLESLFSTHNDSNTSSIFENEDTVLIMLLPILKVRRTLERAIAKDDKVKKGGPLNEKKALLERISTILKNKICKTKLSTSEDEEKMGNYAIELFKEAKRSFSNSHCTCCSAAITLVIKCTQGLNLKCKIVKSIYEEAAEDWSIRRASKLHTVLFEDVVNKFPIISRICLVPFIVKAAENGRSIFIKSESFRLLSALYHGAKGDLATGEDNAKTNGNNLSISSLKDSIIDVINATNSAMEDDDYKKTNRIRDVIKCSDQVISFCINNLSEPKNHVPTLWSSLCATSAALEKVSDKAKSDGLKKQCKKLIEEITNNEAKLNIKPVPEEPKVENAPEQKELDNEKRTKSSVSKKKKKSGKKAKKKR